MKHLVLVIDDKFTERKPGYKRLEAAASTFGNFSVKFEYLESPNDLTLQMRSAKFSAVILDAVLDEEWPGFTVSAALKDISDDIPIALLSGQWDETNVEQVNEAWKRPNCRTFIHWRDIDPEGNGQLDFAVRPFIRMIGDGHDLDIDFRVEPSSSIWILHVSDVQTGGFDATRLKLEAKRCADLILTQTGNIAPTFVAFTGDVAEFGAPSQYTKARDWMGYFLDRLRSGPLPSSRVLYVPGNHDVNLSLAASARLSPHYSHERSTLEIRLSDELKQPELLPYGYAPFRSFHEQICGRKLLSKDFGDQNFAWIEARYRHLGIVFYGINTAQPASAFGVPDRRVDPNALAALSVELAKLLEGQSDAPIVIGLGHHSPVAAEADGAVNNPKDFALFLRANPPTALFLHGHTHEHNLSYTSDGDLRMVRSCATTLTKGAPSRPLDSLRGFNLLELKRNENVVDQLVGQSFGWIGPELKRVKTGQWKRQSDSMFSDFF